MRRALLRLESGFRDVSGLRLGDFGFRALVGFTGISGLSFGRALAALLPPPGQKNLS